MKLRLIVLFVVLGLLLFGGGYFYWHQQQGEKATVVSESAYEREGSMRAAYNPTASSSGQTDHVKFENIAKSGFAKLSKAIEQQDRVALAEVISAKVMLEYVERAGLMKAIPLRQRHNVIAGMQKGLSQGLLNVSSVVDYRDVTIVRIEPIKENEFIVYTSMWNDELDSHTKMRWWFLGVKDKQWAIYDYEDFDTNVRASTLIGAAMANAMGGGSWTRDLLALNRSFHGMNNENILEKLAAAESTARKLLKHKGVPKTVIGYARTMLASSLISQQKFQDALSESEVTLKEHPDMPVAHFSMGTAYLGLERWEQAIQSFEKYADALGWDSDVYEMLSDAHRGKGDLKRAQELASKGLAGNANAKGCLVSYAMSMSDDDRDLLLGYIRKVKKREDAYVYVMDGFIEAEKVVLAKWLLKHLRADFPKSELIDYYDGELEGGANPNSEIPTSE